MWRKLRAKIISLSFFLFFSFQFNLKDIEDSPKEKLKIESNRQSIANKFTMIFT